MLPVLMGGAAYQYLDRLQTQIEDILLDVIRGYKLEIHQYGSPDDVAVFPGRTRKT